ncbi:hypothetical protein DL96DRAFT_1820238 [Flagelloscypha sp. PMI_526]|nr:hypothetical protein DL96DRAFT_1820238 [Flagelloscypha sp. PMI_526]
MSLGPATLRLAAARSVIPFIPEVPSEFFELGDRSWRQDSLLNIEEVDTRQVGGLDLAGLQAEQPRPSNVPREPADLEERTRGADFLSSLWRLGNRNSEELEARQVGSFDLTTLLADQLKPTISPREPADLEGRTRGADFLSRLWRLDDRNSEELDARQVGNFDLTSLIAEQIKPAPVLASGNLPGGASDLEERSRKSDSLLRILGYGRREIEDVSARQLGSFNLPHLVSSSLAGRQVSSFDLPELLAHQFARKAQPDHAESTLKLDREFTKEPEEGIDRVARMIGRKLEHTLD